MPKIEYQQQSLFKKRKRASEEDAEDATKIAVQLSPQAETPVPEQHTPGVLQYFMLPQHIILYIFEFEKHYICEDIGSLFCRFRSQLNERQFFLQYRSIGGCDGVLKGRFSNTDGVPSPCLKFLLHQVRYLDLDISTLDSFILPLLTSSMSPQLMKVHLTCQRSHFDYILNAPRFATEKITRLHGSNGLDVVRVQNLASQLPSLRELDCCSFRSVSAVQEIVSFTQLESLSINDIDEDLAIVALEMLPRLKSFAAYEDDGNPNVYWTNFPAKAGQLKTEIKNLQLWSIKLDAVPVIKSLETLQFGVDDTSFSFQGIEQLENLRALRLGSSLPDYVEDAGLLTQCTKLQKLKMCTYTQITLPTNEHLFAAIRELNERGQLLELSLSGSDDTIGRNADEDDLDPEQPSLWPLRLGQLGIGSPGCALQTLELTDMVLDGAQTTVVESLQNCKDLRFVKIDGVPSRLRKFKDPFCCQN